ncbi:unnamed protein product [Pylaiella littoralis]
MVVGGKGSHPECHFIASGVAAIINFPLWKAAAIGQSGFDRSGRAASKNFLQRYADGLKPPYKGVAATIIGMTWARAFIFYGSDLGKRELEETGYSSRLVTVALPPLVLSTTVQLVNMPIIRASITIQNPDSNMGSVRESLAAIYRRGGVGGLWHGTSAGVMKTVPKYCVAVTVKDYMERNLAPADPSDRWHTLWRSAQKSVAAGVAGAALTNPLDVLRNEMFKTDLGVADAFAKLKREEGMAFAVRGMNKNLVAVAIPIAVTIFVTDILVRATEDGEREDK